MIDGWRRVEFDDVKVVRTNDLFMMCRIGTQIVAVPSHEVLPGTTISGDGDRGRLVLSQRVVFALGLV
jgi:hypothetical protein